jgi:chemotaxis protein CheX
MATLNPQFFRPFLESTIKTLKIQCQTEASPEKPFIKGTQQQPQFELAAVIGLTSDAFTGTITICFTNECYLALMSNMLGETFKEITSELQDGASELLNIIFGQAKIVLNEQGYQIQKAIPTVIRGKDLVTTHVSTAKVMVLPFMTKNGPFHIEICAQTSM